MKNEQLEVLYCNLKHNPVWQDCMKLTQDNIVSDTIRAIDSNDSNNSTNNNSRINSNDNDNASQRVNDMNLFECEYDDINRFDNIKISVSDIESTINPNINDNTNVLTEDVTQKQELIIPPEQYVLLNCFCDVYFLYIIFVYCKQVGNQKYR